jgi:hypothetical protein
MAGWLERLAAKLNRKVEPTAVAVGVGTEGPAVAAPAAVAEIAQDEGAEEE